MAANGYNDVYFNICTDVNCTNWTESIGSYDGIQFALTNINMVAGQYYYIEVMNFSGSPLKTRLSIASGAAAAQVIGLNTAIAFNTLPGMSKIFKFTPTVSRIYRFSTDLYTPTYEYYFAQMGVYSDVGLTTMMPAGFADAGTGQELFLNLTAGTSYYIQLKGYYGQGVYSKLKVENGVLPLYAYMESPSYNQIIKGTFQGRGYALDPNGINRIDVVIDGVVQSQGTYGVNREDLYGYYPLYNNHNSGFNFSINSLLYTVGEHRINIRVTLNNGVQKYVLDIIDGKNGYPIRIEHDNTPPSTPTNFTGTIINDNQVQLSWSPSTDDIGVTGYKIYKDGALLTTLPQTTYTAVFLEESKTYNFVVKAIDAAGNISASSTTVTKTILDKTPPTNPTNLAIMNKTQTGLTLNWSASTDNSGSVSYILYDNGVNVGSTTATSFTLQVLAPNINHSISVKAKDPSGNLSLMSNQIQQFLGIRTTTYVYNAANRIDYLQLSTGEKYKYYYDKNGNQINIVKVN